MAKGMTGRWAVCSHGRIGKIERLEGLIWVGVGIDSKFWQSQKPQLIHNDHSQYLNAIFTEQVKKRLSVTK